MTEFLWQSTAMRSFVEQVQEAAGLDSVEEAEQLTRSTLSTLAESISGGEVDELMQGLPLELRRELANRSGQARSMEKTAFLDRVSGALTTTDLEETEKLTRAVLTTLRQWAPQDEIDGTVQQLPASIGALFK